ncbi:MAG: UbiA family prenyltransferase [Coxiellaceae bacterium]|nr:UbiA family prenyltransferase [Coxiellaceae bacterium]
MNKTPICVDLDGSLTYTDTLFETFVNALKNSPLTAFLAVFWLFFKGKSYCKQRIAAKTNYADFHLPFNQPLVEWLTMKKQQGHTLYLVTAADQRIAHFVIEQLPIFDAAHASDGKTNLKGHYKRDFLDQQFGKGEYVYVGNSKCDIGIFKHAKQSVVVNNKASFINKAKQVSEVTKTFKSGDNNLRQIIKAARPHQYAKNVLLFLPLLLGHHLSNLHLALLTVLGFISFSLLASSAYLLNDLIDLSSDRQHHKKHRRPFASGQLSLSVGLIGSPLCFIAGFGLAIALLPMPFVAVLLLYYACTLAYSFKLKRLLLVDVFTLAMLYTLRIFAGMAILGAVGYSDWLLLFSFFFFTSLAFIKRYSELAAHDQSSKVHLPGRAYHSNHSSEIKIMGMCSGYISVLVFALYIQSARSMALYQLNELLYLICPLLLYWISRVWIITTEGQMHSDPVVFAIKDRVTYLIVAVIAAIVYCATL